MPPPPSPRPPAPPERTQADWQYEFAQDLQTQTPLPNVLSISYAWYELDQCDISPNVAPCTGVPVPAGSVLFVTACNQLYAKAAARGVTMLSASGDSGAHGRTDPSCTDPKTRAGALLLDLLLDRELAPVRARSRALTLSVRVVVLCFMWGRKSRYSFASDGTPISCQRVPPLSSRRTPVPCLLRCRLPLVEPLHHVGRRD